MAGKKYPDYFYENAPIWVERLENGKLLARPRIVKKGKKEVKAYCGSCKHLTETKKFIGEPYCSLLDAAVRGHWSCPKWVFGGNDGPQYVSIKHLDDNP